MKTPNRRQGRKEFQRPKLECYGQMEQIVMQSYNTSGQLTGRGGIWEGTARDIFGS